VGARRRLALGGGLRNAESQKTQIQAQRAPKTNKKRMSYKEEAREKEKEREGHRDQGIK
jgi:hypothetical protein